MLLQLKTAVMYNHQAFKKIMIFNSVMLAYKSVLITDILCILKKLLVTWKFAIFPKNKVCNM